MFVKEDIVEMPVKTASGILIPGRKAIIDATDNRVLGVVSSRYKVIKNEDLLNAIIPVAEDIGMKSEPIVSKTRGGSVTLFRFTSEKIAGEVQKGDIVQFGVEFFNSYDGSYPVGFHITAMRLVCLNGMVVPRSIKELSIRHMKSASPMAIKQELGNYFGNTQNALEIWRKWASERPKLSNVKTFLHENVGRRLEKEFTNRFISLPEQERTTWSLYNLLTYHITHTLKTRKADTKVIKQFELTEYLTDRISRFSESGGKK